MPEHAPKTKTMKASEVRQDFSQVLNRVYRRENRVIVEKSGIPIAAIISADDLKQLQRFEQQRAKAFSVVDEMRAAFADVPDEELSLEVEKAIAEVRAEKTAAAQTARPQQ